MKQVNIINNIFSKNKYKIIFNSIDLNETNIIKITNIKSIPFLKTYFKGILNNNLTMFYTNDLTQFLNFIKKYKTLNINLIIFDQDVYSLNTSLIKENPIIDLMNLLKYNIIKNIIALNQIKKYK